MFKKPRILLLAAFVAIVLSRSPALLIDRPMNIDESVMLAAVLTAQSRGLVPWKDFDTTTIGPLTTWFLVGAAAAGMPTTYRGTHFLAALMWAATGVLVLAMIHIACGTRGAAFAFALLVGVSLSALRPDYLHFTSEVLPAMLLAGAALLVVTCVAQQVDIRRAIVLAFFCGVFCALATLAKLQALPIAVLLCAAALLPLLQHGSGHVLVAGCAVVAGALVPFILLGAWLSSHGVLYLALNSYVYGGASYGASQSLGSEWLKQLSRDLMFGWWALRPFFSTILLAVALLAMLGWRPWPPTTRRGALAMLFLGWFAAALVALVLPSFRFEHHGIFLIAPATVLLTFLVCEATSCCTSGNCRPRGLAQFVRGSPRLVFAGFLALWFLAAAPRMIHSLQGISAPSEKFPNGALAEVCRIVEETVAPGEPIAVWGWAPEINVLTTRPSASRHIISHFLIEENSARQVHRDNFVADLKRSRPAVVVDAVAPGFFTWRRWRADYGAHRAERFPELAAFLAQNYRELVRIAHEGAAERTIVYVRKNPL